jgi:Tfp pilus assembly protein PilO
MDARVQSAITEIKQFLQDDKQRAYAIVSTAVVFSLLYAWFLMLPLGRNFGVLTKRTFKKGQEIKRAEKDVANLSKIEERLTKLTEEFAVYDRQVPGKKEIAIFLDSLAVTAKDSNVRILSVAPVGFTSAPAGSKDLYSSMLVIISAKGGYHEIMRFVGELEKGKGFASIRDARIQYDEKTPTKHDAHIVLKIYVSSKEGKDEKKK